MKNFVFVFILSLSVTLTAVSQEVKVIRDLRFRASLEAQKELFDKITLEANSAIELEKDMSRLGKYYFEGSVEYSPWKFFDVGFEYRYTSNYRPKHDDFVSTNRYAFYLGLKKKIDRLSLAWNVKYQTVDDEFYFGDKTQPGYDVVKNRLKFKYNLPDTKLTPYLVSDIYFQMENKFEPSVMKVTIGGEYKIREFGILSGYYKIERQLFSRVPYVYSTFGVNFCFIF